MLAMNFRGPKRVRIPLEDVADGYRIFSEKLDGCIKPVLVPSSARI